MNLFRNKKSDLLSITHSSHARKGVYTKRLRYYWDESHIDARNLIAQRYSRPDQFRIFSINIVRAIADKRASTYRLSPRRTFIGMDQATGDALYQAMNADSVLQKGSRYLEVCKTVMLQVGWDEQADIPTLNVLTPNVIDVTYTNPERPEQVIVTFPADHADDYIYHAWTTETFQVLNSRGAQLPILGNADNVNPYSVLPFVPWFERVPDNQFFIPGGDDLIAAQDALNVGLASLWRAVEFQSSGQAWASGISANEVLQFGPDRAIALPAGGQFGFAAPNAPIGDIVSALSFVMRQTAAVYGCGEDMFDLSKVAQSGSAKYAGRLDLKEVRQNAIAQARTMEARLFEVLKAVVNAHKPGTIPDKATLGIDFAGLQDQMSEAELLANAQIKAELGIFSPVDVLMATSPDAYPDRQSAFQELKRRSDEAAALGLPL
ncbi:MAG: hypothetical protein JOY99_04120 [Sphingomonadaceae bacterium]|nr:hypothetical protein [Sphingomonadaceae bacterium]